MLLRKYAYVFLLLAVSGTAYSQQILDTWAVRVTWPSNPVPENVESYEVRWFDQQSQVDRVLATVDHIDRSTMSYTTRLAWISSSLQIGDELCINVVAQRGDDRSDPSELGCATIIQLGEVSIVELTRPATVDIEFYEETQ